MPTAARRITVVVDGSSTELQEALAKAADSLKMLGDVVARQARASVTASDMTVKANQQVAASYERTTAAVRSSQLKVVESIRTQVAAQRQAAAEATSASGKTAAAAEQQGAAARRAAEQTTAAAGEEKVAYRETATAAAAGADEQAAAADRAAAAQRKAADAAKLNSDRSVAAFGASSSGLTKLGKTTVLTGVAVAAGSLYMSQKFQAATTRFMTQAGATLQQTEKLRKGILGMAGSVGESPDALAAGMYHIVSSMNAMLPPATRAGEELRILKIAAEGARIGGTGLEETTYTLASAMNVLHQRAGDAQGTMGLLNAIVGSGDMTMTDLLDSLKSGLIPTAQVFGVSMQSVGAALATMGDEGMKGALAGTRLRMTLSLLAAPSAKAAELLTAIGMGSGEVHARTSEMSAALQAAGLSTTTMAADLKKPDGIQVALQDLKRHLEESGLSAENASAVMSRAFGGGRTGATVMLLEQGLGRMNAKYQQQAQIVKSFAPDWVQTQKTLKQQIDDMIGSVDALAVHLGNDLTPAAETLLADLRETASWLDHNKAAAEALAGVVGGVLTVAVAAFVANHLAKMVQGLKEMQAASSWLRNGFASPRATAAAATTAAAAGTTAGGPLGMLEGKGLIGGARSGVGLPGSMSNPVIVAIEAGQFAGLGGESAAGSAVAGSEGQVKTAASEGRTVAEPVAAGERSAAAPVYAGTRSNPEAIAAADRAAAADAAAAASTSETAVAGTAMASVRKGLGGLLDGLMKGGMVAAIGTLGSQIAGSAVGGKAGKEVTSIGSGASIGAAIGTVIEPGLGTAIGAALGAAPGVIKALEGGPRNMRRAEALTDPSHGAPHLGAQVAEAVAAAFKKEEALLASLKDNRAVASAQARARRAAGDRGGTGVAAPTAAERARATQIEAEYQQQAAGALGKGEGEYVLHGKTIPGLQSIIDTSRVDLEKLKPIGREAFMGFIQEMVKTLESEGRLPRASLGRLIGDLKPLLTDLPRMAHTTGQEFTSNLIAALNTNEIAGTLSSLTKQITGRWATEYKLLPVSTHMSLTEVITTTTGDLSQLQVLMHSKAGKARELAEAEFKTLAPALGRYTAEATKDVSSELTALGRHTGPLTLEGTDSIISAYAALPPAIRAQLDHAGGEVQKGISKINSITSVEMKALGVTSNITTKVTAGMHSLFARGGLVQLGRPGEAGRDRIPLNVGGIPIVAGAGETVAVFTRHQRAAAEQQLPGGLPGIFADKTPNYMASGGFVPMPGTNFTAGYEPQIAGDLRKLAGELKETVYGISGYRSPQHSVAVGGFEKDPHTEGKAADIGVGSPTLASMLSVAESALRAVGLYRPFYPASAAEANHVQLVGVPYGNSTGIPAGGGGGASAGVGAATARAARTVGVPPVSDPGEIGAIARGALTKAAAAANAQLQAAAAGGEGSAGGAGGGPSGAGGPVPAGGVRGWLTQALQLTNHFSPANLSALYGRTMQESGGNPRSVNNWDSNAKAGTPSEGLLQTIMPTFRSYMLPGHPDIWNPVDNAAAAIRYMFARYGHIVGPSSSGYAEGGFVNADTGLLADAARYSTRAPKPAKQKITKGTKHTPKVGKGPRAPSLQALISRIGKIPDTENVRSLAAFTPILSGLESERGLLAKIIGEPDHSFVMPQDMAELQATLTAGQGIHPWMTTTEALRDNQRATARNGESTQLALQKELLGYYAELPSHHLLTPADVGVLRGAGVTDPSVKAFASVYGPVENTMEWQINKTADLAGSEENTVANWQVLAGEYRERQEQILAHAKAEYRRAANIKQHIERLTTGTLKAKVAAAEDKFAIAGLKYDAQESEGLLTESIDSENQLPAKDRDKKLLAEWRQQKQHIASYAQSLSRPVSGAPAARVALQKNTLTDELHPIEESLRALTGSATTVGKGGRYGTLGSYVKTLNEGVTRLTTDVGTQRASTIPGLIIELQQQRAEDTDAGLKPAPAIAATASSENSALTQALKEQASVLSQTVALQGAELRTLSAFVPQIPRYEAGGLVADTGFALVHEGEWITPSPKGPYGSQLAPSAPVVHVHHETHVHGSAQGLIDVIDQRVQHPSNTRAVSREISQRTNLLGGGRRIR